jgi:hypothetical protein
MQYLLILSIVCNSTSYSVTRRYIDSNELMKYVQDLELKTNRWNDSTEDEGCWVSEAEWLEEAKND